MFFAQTPRLLSGGRHRRLAFACGFREEKVQGKYMQYAASTAAA